MRGTARNENGSGEFPCLVCREQDRGGSSTGGGPGLEPGWNQGWSPVLAPGSCRATLHKAGPGGGWAEPCTSGCQRGAEPGVCIGLILTWL